MAQHFFKVYEVDSDYMYGDIDGDIEGYVLSRDTLEINDDDGLLHAENAPASGNVAYEDTGTPQQFDFVNQPPVTDYHVEYLDFSNINGGATQFELFAVSVDFNDGSTKYFVMSKDSGFDPEVGDFLAVQSFSTFANTDYTQLGAAVCFTPGALIATPTGHRFVEEIMTGDRVLTADAGAQVVLWVGRQKLSGADLTANPNARPICIKSGVLGNAREITVSPQHKMVLNLKGEEVFIRAKHLASHFRGIARVAYGKREVTYIHLLLSRHRVLFVENARTESLYPGPMAIGAIGKANLLAIEDQAAKVAAAQVARRILSSQEVARSATAIAKSICAKTGQNVAARTVPLENPQPQSKTAPKKRVRPTGPRTASKPLAAFQEFLRAS